MCEHARMFDPSVGFACSIQVIYVEYDLQGEITRRGDLSDADCCNFIIFNFSTWFLAQIVKNPGGHLSRPFLGPGDNFSKSYDENQIWSERTDVPEFFYLTGITAGLYGRSGFHQNLFEKLSPGPKNSLERRASRFFTIRAENQVLKLNIDKVPEICVT